MDVDVFLLTIYQVYHPS